MPPTNYSDDLKKIIHNNNKKQINPEIKIQKIKAIKEISTISLKAFEHFLTQNKILNPKTTIKNIQTNLETFNKMLQNTGLIKVRKKYEYYDEFDYDDSVRQYDLDTYANVQDIPIPDTLGEDGMLSIKLVFGKVLNKFCAFYVKLIHLSDQSEKVLDAIFSTIQLLSKQDIIVYNTQVWSFPVFSVLVYLIHHSKNKKTIARMENLFNVLTNVRNEGKRVVYDYMDTTNALWKEVDNFNNYQDKFKGKERLGKLKRVEKLLIAGAYPFPKRLNIKDKDDQYDTTEDIKEHINATKLVIYDENKGLTQFDIYNRTKDMITIRFFQCFFEDNKKKDDKQFLSALEQILKLYNKERTTRLIERIRYSQNYGLIDKEKALQFNFFLDAEKMFNENVLNRFGYTNGFGYADEYYSEYDSEFGSDEGSFDDAYGFGASADEYDDY